LTPSTKNWHNTGERSFGRAFWAGERAGEQSVILPTITAISGRDAAKAILQRSAVLYESGHHDYRHDSGRRQRASLPGAVMSTCRGNIQKLSNCFSGLKQLMMMVMKALSKTPTHPVVSE